MAVLKTLAAGVAALGLTLAATDTVRAAPAPATVGVESPAAYLKLITELQASGRPRAALAHLDAYDLKNPRDIQAKVLRADCLVDVGQYDEAETLYRKQVAGPQAARAYSGLGRIAGLRGDWKLASVEFSRAVQRAPVDATYIGDLGFALLRAGDTAGALFRLRQAGELAPDSPTIRNNLILTFEASGDAERAKALMAQVKDPEDRKAIAAMRNEMKAASVGTSAKLASASAAGR